MKLDTLAYILRQLVGAMLILFASYGALQLLAIYISWKADVYENESLGVVLRTLSVIVLLAVIYTTVKKSDMSGE